LKKKQLILFNCTFFKFIFIAPNNHS
jgi:hypothetical protein